MTDLPPPPISAEVDLTNFPFMPLNVRQLRDSRFAATADGESFRCGVLLWCAAWHQVPAGSLPSDDVELAQLAGFGRAVKEWKRVRTGSLYGWREHSDGRLYHPVVVSAALEAWQRREQWQEQAANDGDRKSRYRHRLKHISAELRALGVSIPKNRSLEALEQILADAKSKSAGTQRGRCGDASADTSGDDIPSTAGTLRGRSGDTADAPGMAKTGKGQVRDKERTHTERGDAPGTRAGTSTPHESTPPGDESRPAAASHGQVPLATPTPAAAVCVAMRDAGLTNANPSHAVLLELIGEGAEIGEFVEAAREAAGKGKRFDYALGIVRSRRADAVRLGTTGLQGALPVKRTATEELLANLNQPRVIDHDG